MGNSVAYLMLILWPLVCLWMVRKMPIERAVVWSILGGYLALPPITEFDLPLIPSMNKHTIPSVAILFILMFMTKERLRLVPETRLATVLAFVFVASSIPSVISNADPIFFELMKDTGPIRFIVDALPGQSFRDIGSVFLAQAIMLVPFFLARQYLSTDQGLKELTIAFMVGGLIYSIPSLIEIRLSPQLNTWIYGFFQHSFAQMMRGDGFRPIVFLQHGLWLALFICTTAVAAAALARAAPKASPYNRRAPDPAGDPFAIPRLSRTKLFWIVLYLFVLLILCKSWASIAFGFLLVPAVLILSVRLQVLMAMGFAIVALTYPVVRNLNALPLDAIVEQIRPINPERAHSLDYRFHNEQLLLERAAEKPIFGWAGWGRNLEREADTGEVISVPDGRWIIIFGTYGWAGYIAEFGLLGLPLFMMGWLVIKHRRIKLSPYIGASCLILGITLMDMLLNATLTPLTWLSAGSILGYAERLNPNRGKIHRTPIAMKPAISGTASPPARTIF